MHLCDIGQVFFKTFTSMSRKCGFGKYLVLGLCDPSHVKSDYFSPCLIDWLITIDMTFLSPLSVSKSVIASQGLVKLDKCYNLEK